MYAFPGLYMPRVGSRQASLNKLIWCTLLCYLLCSGDKIWHLCVVLQNTSGLLRRYQGYLFLTVSKLVSHSKLKLLTFCYNLTLIIYSPDEEN